MARARADPLALIDSEQYAEGKISHFTAPLRGPIQCQRLILATEAG
jgi:hypothetical protein